VPPSYLGGFFRSGVDAKPHSLAVLPYQRSEILEASYECNDTMMDPDLSSVPSGLWRRAYVDLAIWRQ
jgi:hypothetical protein